LQSVPRQQPRRALATASASRIFILFTALTTPAAAQSTSEMEFDHRTLLIHVPAHLPASGSRSLVVVLHGGLGNARNIEARLTESGLNMDGVADRSGFIVAYPNGTPVTRLLGPERLGWNAGGGCCGLSAERRVDDVDYIIRAIDSLVIRYGIDRGRIYGIGHSNGAMMTQRLLCETGVYAAAVAISGPLNLANATCAAARGKALLAIHGAEDANVPIAGGRGSAGLSRAAYNSEERSQQIFQRAGASYTLQIVPGADHKLGDIDAAIQRTEGVTIAEKAARFFGLLP